MAWHLVGDKNDMTVMKKTTTLFAVLGLAACGGSNGGAIVAPNFSEADQELRTFADVSGDFGAILDDSGTLSSRAGTAVAVQLRFNGGTTNLTDASVAVSKNAAGELTATLNGESREFTVTDRQIEGDGNTYGYEFEAANGTTFSIFHFGGSLEELLTEGNGFGTIVSVGADLGPDGDTLYHRSFAAIGGETADLALSEITGSATFDGNGRIDFYPTEDFINSGTSRGRLRGDVTMTANFDAGEISGAIQDLTLQAPGASERAAIGGQVDFNTAEFEANTFAGAVTGNAALAASGIVLNDDAAYNGAFFGPDADEVHGVISATGSLDGKDMNAIGYFTQ
ncbi:MAG: hypothetical protein ACI84R_004204 [Candidatus Azotimanducaceae bacterium]|jgi:hypothetical protein